MFYKSDHILHANKCLKMRKYFTKEQTECKRMHTSSDIDIQSNQNTHKSIRISMSTIFYLFLHKNLLVSILHKQCAKIPTLDHLLYTLFSLNNIFFYFFISPSHIKYFCIRTYLFLFYINNLHKYPH